MAILKKNDLKMLKNINKQKKVKEGISKTEEKKRSIMMAMQ